MSITRRTKFFIGLGLVAALGAGAEDSDAAKSTRTAKLLKPAVVKSFPGGGETVARVAATRPLTGQPTVLPVLGTAKADGRPWLRVRLPQRPNGSTGWIAADGTRKSSTPYKVVVTRSSRVAKLYKRGRVVRSFRVVVGAASTPTPGGQFFIAERVAQPAGTATGPFVLATSAYSNVLQQFGGGPGQIGLHGRTGLSDPLGSAASHGCVRFTDASIRWLAKRLGAGVPVTIR